MSIADELNHYAGGLEDAYDAAQDMGAVIPANRNMDNLDAAIRTIPQPSVNDGILTITQNGTTAGSFTANQASNTTVALTDTTYNNFTGTDGQTAGTAGLVPAPATTDAGEFLKADGTWDTPPGVTYTAGSNIQINGTTISATDTTYSDFTGSTGVADGAAGLVPKPLIADTGKFLKGDGTWDTPADTTYTAGTNVSISAQNVISATDTTYSAFTGATSSVAGTSGLVPAPTTSDPDKYLKGDGTWSEPAAKLVEMSYGEANAWAKFIAAYDAGSIVYCRASSNANPGTGSQTRKAFMAYVNNATTPTSVEFQYVRSVSSKSSSQPVDQVFVYTLTNANGGTWSVATRDMAPKLAAGTNASVSYSSGTYTISATDTTYSAFTGATSGAAGTSGLVPAPAAGDEAKVLAGDGTWKDAGGGGTVTYYIADGDPNYPQTLSNGFIYEDAARTTRAEADDIYADIQSGKIVYLEYRTGPATDRRETLFTINSMTRRDTQDIVDQYDYFGSMTSYMDGSNTNQPTTFGFLVQGTEPVTWQFVQQYIPTVNNGTLTIQQNGTTVDTFTANQSTNVTANIDTHNGVLTANDLSPATDTVADWLTLFNSTPGYYVTFYSGTTGFTNQPATWGQLETFISAQTSDPTKFEIYQRWHSQSDGGEYYRAGNATGWYNEASNSGAFRAVVDYSTPRWSSYTISDTTLTDRTWTTPKGRSLTVAAAGNAGVAVGISGGCDRDILAFKMSANYYVSTPISTTIGITNIKPDTVMTNAFWGVVGDVSKAGTVFTKTPTSNYTNFYTDTNSSSGIFAFNVSGSRYTGGDWFELVGSLHYGNDYINFVTRCSASGASVLPKIYMRGTTMVLGSRNVTIEVLE